jgi:hypothetical protein
VRRTAWIAGFVCLFGMLIATAPAFAQDLFVDSGQRLGNSATWQVASGDLDGDGDLDVVTTNTEAAAEIWLNDGRGFFTDSGRRLDRCALVEVADLDGDGALDVITSLWGGALTIWWNDGEGGFSEVQTTRVGSDSLSLAVGDLDGDGDLDIYLGRASADIILENRGSRVFRDTYKRYGSRETGGVIIGDMDGDGDNDIVAAGWDEPGHVWANDGSGRFTILCELDAAALHVHDATAGDYDGDGDLDVFFALAGGICCRNVWLNDGTGRLAPLDVNFGIANAHGVAAADLNGDGAPDLAFAVGGTARTSCQIWLRDGDGFYDSGLRIGDAMSGGLEFADFDGDGDLDLYVGFHVYTPGSWVYGAQPNEVWFNTTEPVDGG